MGRRRTGEKPPDPPVDADGVAVMEPERNGLAPGPAPAEKPNRPVATFAAGSDRTTRLEVAVWARQVRVDAGEEYTQFALTVARSWRNPDGVWAENGRYRAHDVPVLLFLIEQAYHWCLLQRADVRVASDEPLPF